MIAALSTWTLDAAARCDSAVTSLLREMVRTKVGLLRQAGMVDCFLLHLPPDEIVMIALYESIEDAAAAGPIAREGITASVGPRIQLQGRRTGLVMNSVHDSTEESGGFGQRRDEAKAMFATLASWHLGPTLRSLRALEHYIAEGTRRFHPLLRELGLIDALVIRLGEDEMEVLSLYEDPVDGQAAHQEALTAMAGYMEGQVELVRTRSGRAYDIPLLLDDAA
jgi:hypothetical protein